MKKLVVEIFDDMKKKNKNKKTIPKCWICMDEGLVYYDKKENGIRYEMAARCRCIKGQKIGEKVGYIPNALAEDIARINFEYFNEKHPEEISKIAL